MVVGRGGGRGMRWCDGAPELCPVPRALPQLLGPDHPTVANRLNNLASVLAEQGKVEEAEAMMREALQARIKVSSCCVGVTGARLWRRRTARCRHAADWAVGA